MSRLWKTKSLYTDRRTLVEQAYAVAAESNEFYVRASDGRIDHGTDAQPISTPWIHVKDSPERHCNLWNQVYFQRFGLLPSFCRFCCWKVVFKPKCVVDLFEMEKVLEKMNLPSKLGMDVRDYSPGPWAGFIYNNSLKEGRQTLQALHERMCEHFGEDHDVDAFLKRGCTEMEYKLPSDQWDDVSEQAVELERMLDEMFVKHEASAQQSDWVKQTLRNRWVKYALNIGDPTWRQLVDDPKNYIAHTVKYDTDERFYETMSPEGQEKAKENY